MRILSLLFLTAFFLSSCCKEQWIFNTRTCSSKVGLYDQDKIEAVEVQKNKGKEKEKQVSEATKSTENIEEKEQTVPTGDDIKWYKLKEQIISKYYDATIKGGSGFIIVGKSRKKDTQEIKQVICDYWKP